MGDNSLESQGISETDINTAKRSWVALKGLGT